MTISKNVAFNFKLVVKVLHVTQTQTKLYFSILHCILASKKHKFSKEH